MTGKKIIKSERFVQKGYTIGFDENKTYLIKGAIPGEDVAIKEISSKKSGKISEVVVEDVVSPSENRQPPFCKYYEKCGGCNFQYIKEDRQILYKKEILQDALRQNAKTEFNDIVLHKSPKITKYRNKASMPYNRKSGKLGLYEEGTHNIIDIETCDILEDAVSKGIEFLNKELVKNNKIRYMMVRGNYKGDISLIIISKSNINVFDYLPKNNPFENIYLNINKSGGNRIIGDEIITVKGNNEIYDRWNDIDIYYSPIAFMQVNRYVAQDIYSFIANMINKKEKVVDLFSGVGILSMILAKNNISVDAVEIDENAVISARNNAGMNNLNVPVFHKDANLFNISPYDVVLIDPPRRGINENLLNKLAGYKGKIIYMSCYPQTLSRDVGMLLKNGWSIKSVNLFDMFPQTYHFETVLVLQRD